MTSDAAGLEVALDFRGVDRRPSPAPTRWAADGATPLLEGTTRVAGGLEVVCSISALGSGRRLDLEVRHPPGPGAAPVALDRLRLRLAWRPRRVLEHGWQSWSHVAPRPVTEVTPARRWSPHWLRATYHALPELAGRAVTGDQFLVCAEGCTSAVGRREGSGGVVGFLDGRRHLSTVVATSECLVVLALLDGVVLAPGRRRTLDPLWLAAGEPGPTYSEYVGHWAAVAGGRAGGASPLGWSSWYQYFSKVTPADVRANLALAAGRGFGLFQLDDGYQRAVGDWLVPNDRFAPGEVAALAAEIGAAGLQPGIWTAPFLAGGRSSLARRHPEWLAQRPSWGPGGGGGAGRPLRAMFNPAAWGGWAYALDTTQPAVLEHLRQTFAALAAQGWTYHKIDFCYAAAMPGLRRGDGTMTRAQALVAGLEAVRQGIGPGSVLLGCGIPLAQSVGLVDALRVSPDTAPKWASGLVRAPGYPDTAPAARNAVGPSVWRAPMHRRLWVNDPDCLLLRPTGSRLDARQRRMLAEMVAGTGSFTVVSDDLSTYGPDQWAQLERLATIREAADTRLEVVDPFAAPVSVRGRGGLELEMTWPTGAGATGRGDVPRRAGRAGRESRRGQAGRWPQLRLAGRVATPFEGTGGAGTPSG